MQFSPGDVVRLKSGGPQMTVQEIVEDGTVLCIWFENKDRKTGGFPPATLSKVEQRPLGASAVRRSPWA